MRSAHIEASVATELNSPRKGAPLSRRLLSGSDVAMRDVELALVTDEQLLVSGRT